MRYLLGEHWWTICVVLAALAFLAFRLRQQERMPRRAIPPQPTRQPRSFAAIRSFSPEELQPFFGTYALSPLEVAGLSFFVIFLSAIGAILAFSISPSVTALCVTAAGGGCLGAIGVFLEARSKRVIGLDRIAFLSPIPAFSWSVPMRDVIQCDLVPGKPHNRLRVHTHQGSHTLPLTTQLWQRLRSAGSA